MKTILKPVLITLALVTAVWLAITLAMQLKTTVQARGGKPPPPPPLDAGTIYFSTDAKVHSMRPDGTGKSVILGQPLGEAEVSRALHNGKRWFLVMVANTNEFYPDNTRARQEFYAVSTNGDWVQLTADPTVQPNTDIAGSACPRWTARDGIVDGRVTFVGRRWLQEPDGSWTVMHGVFAVDFDPETLGAGFTPQVPQLLPIFLPVQDIFASQSMPYFGFATVVLGCDWSPDGSRLAYALDDGRLYVAWANDGTFQVLFSSFVVQYPRWSPLQTNGSSQILFVADGVRIDRLNEDGSGWANVIPAPRKPNLGTDPVRWSPAGTYFNYKVWTLDKKGNRVGTAIYRAAASGSGNGVNLTSGILWATPLGWMLP